MNWYLVTYADENFKEEQDFLEKVHEKSFTVKKYNREWLETTTFYSETKEILDQSKGAGWWTWKPYVILDALNNSNEGDYVVYCDCGDMFSPGLKNYIENNLSQDDPCLLLVGNNTNKFFTKRDCFVLMNCDEEDYWNSKQLECGFMVWKTCDKSKEIVLEWLRYCKNISIINNDPSSLSEEFGGFKEHRNDQSVLTNIAVREGLPVGGSEYRNYIECDYDYWYERYPSSNLGREIDSFLLKIKDA